MIDLLLAVGLAVFVSAFCSVTEAVLYSVPWSHIEHLRKSGRRAGRQLFELRSDVDRPITAVLTLNTLAHTAGASIAGAAAVRVFGSDALSYFAAVFTAVILIFSEILPKSIGVAYSRQLVPFLAGPLKFLVFIFLPVHWITGFLSRSVGRSAGPQTTEDDIRAVVSLTRQSGIIKPYEESTIKNILLLDKKMVHHVMTPRTVVFSLSASSTVKEAGELKDLWHYSRIPVYDNDDPEDIVGIAYRRRILDELARDRHDRKIVEIMRPVRFVVESLSLDRLLLKFLESRVHLFVVLDEYGGMAGVITLEDVVEEILGKEIVDETDEVEDMRSLARMQRDELTKSK